MLKSEFCALYERWHRVLWAHFRARVPAQDVPDLVQEVFFRAYNGIDRCKLAERGPWLFGIAKRVYLEYLRRRHRVNLMPEHIESSEPFWDLSGISDDLQMVKHLMLELQRSGHVSTFDDQVLEAKLAGKPVRVIADEVGVLPWRVTEAFEHLLSKLKGFLDGKPLLDVTPLKPAPCQSTPRSRSEESNAGSKTRGTQTSSQQVERSGSEMRSLRVTDFAADGAWPELQQAVAGFKS